ncbi:MAG TPA: extracellular solute-binding protein, partial [Dermatophilaceae bacterium]|nr:extracellular solute-binding protein [Dermatophilaceae bacterium]
AGSTGDAGGGTNLEVLIGSSGDAETRAVTRAAQDWASETGNTVRVLPAQDLVQQLGQGFAGGAPPDLFYVDSEFVGGFFQQGSLLAYGDQIDDVEDFIPSLNASFTFDDELVCVPKDFSTLALVINTDAWEAAGLTDADVPTTWDELASVAGTLTTGNQTGLVLGGEYARIGAFMEQAGGGVLSDDGTQAIADSPENLEALTFVKQMLEDGVAGFPGDVGAGWGGEAFGLGEAAMTIEGNWIKGALSADYPDINYIVAELPEGPAGRGTMQFTVCWGIASQSTNQEVAIDLVNYLTLPEQQLAISKSFGVMPSRASALKTFTADNPDDAAFVAGADYGQVPPNIPGIQEAIAEFNSQLSQLRTTDPATILADLQRNSEAALGG